MSIHNVAICVTIGQPGAMRRSRARFRSSATSIASSTTKPCVWRTRADIRQLDIGLPHLANLAADVRLAYTLSWGFTELVRVSLTGGDRDICSMEHAMDKA